MCRKDTDGALSGGGSAKAVEVRKAAEADREGADGNLCGGKIKGKMDDEESAQGCF